ncbi:hypothetical protein NL444_27375, partial [Klebsiella pneumoniae]|nr:hypothetical protein [Klebsiella pneumoniae]
PRRLKDIRPGAEGSYPSGFTRLGDMLLFTANDGSSGLELWRTDGTEAGTRRVADLQAGGADSLPNAMVAFGNRVVFSADDGRHGFE